MFSRAIIATRESRWLEWSSLVKKIYIPWWSTHLLALPPLPFYYHSPSFTSWHKKQGEICPTNTWDVDDFNENSQVLLGCFYLFSVFFFPFLHRSFIYLLMNTGLVCTNFAHILTYREDRTVRYCALIFRCLYTWHAIKVLGGIGNWTLGCRVMVSMVAFHLTGIWSRINLPCRKMRCENELLLEFGFEDEKIPLGFTEIRFWFGVDT